MKFWLAKTGNVSLREQLAAQIILGIASRDLAPGQRLPSTRELARRYGIHANTVSAAYRDLARRGWVSFRPGSGIFVRTDAPVDTPGEPPQLDVIATLFVRQAKEAGFPASRIQAAIERALAAPEPTHFLVIEPDPGLRAILVAEVMLATGRQVQGAHPAKLTSKNLAGAVPLAMVDELNAVREHLPAAAECVELKLTSVPAALLGAERPPDDAILAVISKWPEFLSWARTMLLAAGIDDTAILIRDARRSNWPRGVDSAQVLICDVVAGRLLGNDPRVRTFPIIGADSINELNEIAARFDFPSL
jgi:GntR family transcriptional regulator